MPSPQSLRGSAHNFARILSLVSAALLIAACAPLASAQLTSSSDFTVIALPDTQNESQYNPQMFSSQTQWIVNNKAKYNIQMVLGEGDIVNDGASTTQQQNADAAIKLLDNAKIPYMLAIGNHDYDGANTGASKRSAKGFNTWWGPARYSSYTYYNSSTYPSGSNENFYGVLTISGKPYLFLVLEYVPRSAALSWATSILNANTDKDVIMVTHSNMYWDGTRVDRCDTNDLNRDNDGDETWKNFTSKIPRMRLVLSGHITTGKAARRKDLGTSGNLVNQVYANYQTETNGNGWLRIMTFHPTTNTISVSTYSPYLNAFKTDSANQFTLNILAPAVASGSTGTISGLVRGDRSTNTYNCLKVSGATVKTSTGSATTDSTGHYAFNTLTPSTYSLTVTAKGWYSATVSAGVNGTYTTDQNFFLQPIVGSATGKVTTSSGTAISGATVKFVGGTLATSRSVTTNSSGVYSISTLSIGSYQVTASASGHTSVTKSTTIGTNTTTTLNFTM